MSTRSSKQSLQDPKNKQDVLKAILNVKKYAKNLKVTSWPILEKRRHILWAKPWWRNPWNYFQSLFFLIIQGKVFLPLCRSCIEASETLIKDEISYRETSSKVLRQKKGIYLIKKIIQWLACRALKEKNCQHLQSINRINMPANNLQKSDLLGKELILWKTQSRAKDNFLAKAIKGKTYGLK